MLIHLFINVIPIRFSHPFTTSFVQITLVSTFEGSRSSKCLGFYLEETPCDSFQFNSFQFLFLKVFVVLFL